MIAFFTTLQGLVASSTKYIIYLCFASTCKNPTKVHRLQENAADISAFTIIANRDLIVTELPGWKACFSLHSELE
jgi:hypothetical protein